MVGKRISIRALVVGLLMIIGSSQAIPNSRILGGSDTSAGQYPWSASVRVDGAHACGGSIISNKYILTAGHCVSSLGSTSIDNSRVTVRMGSINQLAGGQIVSIMSIVIHPSYGNFMHDIAILGLSEPVEFTDKINKIDLASEDDIFEEGTSAFVTGWGLDKTGSYPYKLQSVTMSVLSGPECEAQAGFGYDSVICLEHPESIGICRGDYGAGVVSANKLIAVASFSFGNCGTKYPDVSSKISYYSSWINSVIT